MKRAAVVPQDQITKLRSTLDTEGKEKAQVIASNAEITKRVSSLEAELTQQRELHTASVIMRGPRVIWRARRIPAALVATSAGLV